MNILLIEDDTRLCDTLSYLFSEEGILVSYKNTLRDGKDALLKSSFNVLVLDRMLPDGDGIQLIQELRLEHNNIPILILTALNETDEKVSGIECGADDYMVKPFEFKELLARVKMLTRRSNIAPLQNIISYADVSYDRISHIITCNGQSTLLSKKESLLFLLLISKPGQPIPREDLINQVWGNYTAIENGNLDNQIYFLRKQLSIVRSSTTIKVSRGVGYYLSEN